MTIAELVVKLAVKGAETTVKGLSGIVKGLDQIASTSLAAKAALVGVVIGVERLTGWASQAGMDLYKFGVTTGLSTDELQKWQYALGRFDVSGEETTNTIMGIQQAMSDMLLGKGSPEGLTMLADKVGFDQTKARDTFYVLSKIQEFVKTQPPDIAGNLMKSFGISGNMFQALKSMNLERDKLSKGQIISSGEIERLKNINMAWKDFWFTLRTMGIKFVAAEGIQGIHALTGAFRTLVRAGKYVTDLIQKFQALKIVLMMIGAVIVAYFAPVYGVIIGLIAVLARLDEIKNKQGKLDKPSNVPGIDVGKQNGVPGMDLSNWMKPVQDMSAKDHALPLMDWNARPAQAPSGNMQQTNTFNIDGASSPQDTADAVQKAITRTARQMSSQNGGF